MEKAYILYSKRSCVTGRNLFYFLKENNIGGFEWYRSLKSIDNESPSLIIRWGNSTSRANAHEINTKEAVKNASNKLTMITKFLEKNISTPPVTIIDENFLSKYSNRISEDFFNGKRFFVRNVNDHVRFCDINSTINSMDKYVTEEINKIMELRVHVFNNKCIGVYEKIPENSDTKVYKNENSRFRRIDRSKKENTNEISEAIDLAIMAVDSLGLVFGGADVIKDENGQWFVLEVNSSPALNSPNIERWGNCFNEYINNLTLS
jgi:glutathione synthase/RimK-type ligase-like ATP-grasp enzyme